ncbi:hypothetical protein BDK88_0552 [Natrinema hispanicum]|uniref:Uncharacterized protein n=2 Tax=Natrinema hispanicum TaxID=392421 RepID=A0A482YFS5_9EURY|nr:hypothetical protein BDK88_0552 [Natrinema hispanicum]
MNRSIPPLLALLLVSSLAVVPGMVTSGSSAGAPATMSVQHEVAAIDPADSGLQPVSNTTNRLSLEGAARSEYAEYGPDLGVALASTDDELRIDHTQYVTLDRQFNNATTEERRALLQTTYDRLKDRSNTLREREKQAVRAHAAGDLSSRQLLKTLLRNYQEAAALSEAFDTLEERSDRVSGSSLSVADQQDKLKMHRTQIRGQLWSSAYGNGAIEYISVETSESGYVLETLDEDYLREATRFDNRDTSMSTQFANLPEAYGHSDDLYPWAYDTGQSPSVSEYTTAQLYQIDISHEQGQLKAYLDGGTGDIHRELQTLIPEILPPVRQQEWQKDGLEIVVDKTAANGPRKVTVTNRETGEPVTAPITISDFDVGETNADGSLWYVPPSGGYELTVERPTGSNVTVPVSNS